MNTLLWVFTGLLVLAAVAVPVLGVALRICVKLLETYLSWFWLRECRYCHMKRHEHPRGKCLFGSSKFKAKKKSRYGEFSLRGFFDGNGMDP